jgi:hypothetical protein
MRSAFLLGLAAVLATGGSADEVPRISSYQEALDLLLPLPSESDRLGREVHWRVTVRAADGGTREYAIRVELAWDGHVRAERHESSGTSVSEQWMRLQSKPVSAAEFARNVPIRVDRFDSARCPQLNTLAEEASHSKVELVPSSELELDARHYWIVTETRAGRLTVESSEGAVNIAVPWVAHLTEALRQCE